jgi:hypothetical protein
MTLGDASQPLAWATMVLGTAWAITPVVAQMAIGKGQSQLREQAITFPVGPVTLFGTSISTWMIFRTINWRQNDSAGHLRHLRAKSTRFWKPQDHLVWLLFPCV